MKTPITEILHFTSPTVRYHVLDQLFFLIGFFSLYSLFGPIGQFFIESQPIFPIPANELWAMAGINVGICLSWAVFLNFRILFRNKENVTQSNRMNATKYALYVIGVVSVIVAVFHPFFYNVARAVCAIVAIPVMHIFLPYIVRDIIDGKINLQELQGTQNAFPKKNVVILGSIALILFTVLILAIFSF